MHRVEDAICKWSLSTDVHDRIYPLFVLPLHLSHLLDQLIIICPVSATSRIVSKGRPTHLVTLDAQQCPRRPLGQL